MGLSRTDLLGSTTAGGFGPGAYTTAAFTPPDNSLLCVTIEAIDDSGSNIATTLTLSDSAGLTWLKRISVDTGSGGFNTATQFYMAPVTTGVSMTLTLDAGALNIQHYSVSVVAYTGHNAASPIGVTASGIQTSGFTGPPDPFSLTLSGAPASTSEVFAALGANRSTSGATPGSGWTEVHDVQGSGAWGGLQTQVRTGSTSTSVTWADARAGGGSLFNLAAIAVEIKAETSNAGAVAGSLPGLAGALAGSVVVPAAVAGALPAVGGTLAADLRALGAVAGALPALSGSLLGDLVQVGVIGGVLPALGGSLVGTTALVGLLGGQLPGLAGVLVGNVLPLIDGLIAGSLPALGGALTDFLEVVAGNPAELLVNRFNTTAFIAADPVTIKLRTREAARTPSGAYNYAASGLRSAQVFKIIMQSPAGSSIEQRTEDGTERQVDYILLGEWDAEIAVGDWWDDLLGNRWEVRAIVPRNGYETRAVVEAHGKYLEGG